MYMYIHARPNTCVYVYKDVHTDWSQGTRESLTALDQKGKDPPRCRNGNTIFHAKHLVQRV